jgi:hypothetical protein
VVIYVPAPCAPPLWKTARCAGNHSRDLLKPFGLE